MVKGYKHVEQRESDLMKKWKKDGLSITRVKELTGRGKETIVKHSNANMKVTPGSGRRKLITEVVFKKLEKALEKLLKKADAEWEVSVGAVMALAGVTTSEKTVLEAFHERGIWFRPLREKPILTEADVAKRVVFTAENRNRPKESWVTKPHAVIDNKHFVLYRKRADRNEAARRKVRGGYRPRNQGPKPYLVKRKKNQKYPAPGVQVTAAVIKGKIRVFDFVKGNWGAAKAAQMYKGVLLRALRRSFPEHAARRNAKWCVLEDNDPAGYKSAGGKAAKKEANIVSMDLPPRSPDMNVLDYSLWSAINSAMRLQERSFRKNKKESKEQYMARLKKTALGLPRAQVEKAVMDMRRRVRAIYDADGGLIIE